MSTKLPAPVRTESVPAPSRVSIGGPRTGAGFSLTFCSSKEAWLAERRKGITASELGALLGVDPYLSRYALWCSKVGLVDDPEIVSEAAEWGNILEEPVAAKWAREADRLVIDHGRMTIARGDHPHLMATLDREIAGDPLDGRGNGILEVKTCGYLQREAWEYEPPLKFLLQVHGQLAVTGHRWGVIAALIGGQDFRAYEIQRNEELLALIFDRIDEFMVLVRDRIEPEPDGSDSTRKVLAKLYPEDNGVEVEIDLTEGLVLHQQREEARIEIKAAEEKKQAIDNKLRALIGNASFGRIGGTPLVYSLKTVKKAAYSVAPQQYRDLRLRGRD